MMFVESHSKENKLWKHFRKLGRLIVVVAKNVEEHKCCVVNRCFMTVNPLSGSIIDVLWTYVWFVFPNIEISLCLPSYIDENILSNCFTFDKVVIVTHITL